jgi:membrane associated rhomboid family serine protease
MVSYPESNYLFPMSEWRSYGIHKGLFIWPGIAVLLAWLVFTLNVALALHLNRFGLAPGEFHTGYRILWYPFLHKDLNHILSNTLSIFFVGVLIRYSFPKIFEKVWIASFLGSGIGLWVIGRAGIHIGASGWLYALVSFVFFSGIIRMHIKLLAQSMLMVFLYGSFVWGILPHDPTISWEGHLSGAIAGLLLAVVFRKSEPIEALQNKEYLFEEEILETPDLGDLEVHYERITNVPHTPLSPPPRLQFRYEDGSSPDEWV